MSSTNTKNGKPIVSNSCPESKDEKQTARIKRTMERNAKRVTETATEIEKRSKLDTVVNVHARKAIETMLQYGYESDEFGLEIMQLATILAHSKLKAMMKTDQTFRLEFVDFKHDITAESKFNQYLDQLETLYTLKYKQTGDITVVCSDSKLAGKIMEKIASLAGLTANDLTSVCYVQLLDTIKTAIDSGKTIDTELLLAPYVTYEKRSMTYKDGTLKPEYLWSAYSTNAVKNAGAEVRRYITAERGVREQNRLYYAITSTLADGSERTGYRKANNMTAYEITDMNGKPLAIVSNQSSAELFARIPEIANLTQREAYILRKHYMDNMSLLEIADSLHISETAVKKVDRKLKDKIVKAHIFVDYIEADRKKSPEEMPIYCYMADDESKTPVAKFSSIGNASKVMNIDKGLISKVVNGKRKTAKGMVFAIWTETE